MTAEIDSVGAETLGVVCAMGDWFGGYALFVVDGVAHFAFARAADALALHDDAVMGAGRRTIAVSYKFGSDGGPGQMELSIDGRRADATPVEGMLPLALQHGGAGLRLGYDSGFPVSRLYRPPAEFSGTIHFVKIETLGAPVISPTEEVRTALHGD
jgi:arylsulfatase